MGIFPSAWPCPLHPSRPGFPSSVLRSRTALTVTSPCTCGPEGLCCWAEQPLPARHGAGLGSRRQACRVLRYLWSRFLLSQAGPLCWKSPSSWVDRQTGHDADDTPTCPAEGPSDIVSSRGHHAICVTKAVPCLSPLPSKSKISLVSRS